MGTPTSSKPTARTGCRGRQGQRARPSRPKRDPGEGARSQLLGPGTCSRSSLSAQQRPGPVGGPPPPMRDPQGHSRTAATSSRGRTRTTCSCQDCTRTRQNTRGHGCQATSFPRAHSGVPVAWGSLTAPRLLEAEGQAPLHVLGWDTAPASPPLLRRSREGSTGQGLAASWSPEL